MNVQLFFIINSAVQLRISLSGKAWRNIVATVPFSDIQSAFATQNKWSYEEEKKDQQLRGIEPWYYKIASI